MRIAYLCSDAGVPIGGPKGASVHVAEMTRAMADLGHEVRIFARRTVAGQEPTAPGAAHVLEPRISLSVPPADAIDAALEGWLRADPDAGRAEAWTVSAIAGAGAFRRQAREEVRDFAPDLLYERYALFGAAGASLADELAVPFVLEVNAPLSDEQAAHRGLGFPGASRAMERHILGRADAVVAVSGAVRDWLAGQGVPVDRIEVLANGVDTQRFRPNMLTHERRAAARCRLALGAGPVVGFVGTLKPWHDVASLLRAVALLRQDGVPVVALIVGEGPQRRELEALATELELAAVTTFTGAVPHDRIPALLSVMDVGVAPYRPQEGFYFSPLKLFEYLAAGLPVVAARMGDIGHCVGAGTGGWGYAAGDAPSLADALRAALRDPQEAARRGRAGRDHVLAGHTWRHNAERVLAMAERCTMTTAACRGTLARRAVPVGGGI